MVAVSEEHTAQTSQERPGGPWDDAELVIFTADEEWAKGEPKHEPLEKLGLVSFSLWARWEDDGVEIPILAESSWHTWYSVNPDSFEPDEADRVSDAFIASIVEMVDEDVGDGWGDVTEETYMNMRAVEKYIWQLTREAFLKAQNAEPAMIIDWCEKHYDRGES